MDRRRRCARCGEIVGVYEPIVLLEGEFSEVTSIAAGAELGAGAVYHLACAERREDERDRGLLD